MADGYGVEMEAYALMKWRTRSDNRLWVVAVDAADVDDRWVVVEIKEPSDQRAQDNLAPLTLESTSSDPTSGHGQRRKALPI